MPSADGAAIEGAEKEGAVGMTDETLLPEPELSNERIVSLNDRFSNLGKKLDGAVEAYNTAIGSLESRVHVSARRMAELGIANASDLGQNPPIEKATRRSEAKPEARSTSEDEASSAPLPIPPSTAP